jgi:hypothetical protein
MSMLASYVSASLRRVIPALRSSATTLARRTLVANVSYRHTQTLQRRNFSLHHVKVCI